jgi:uncharacterized protein YndB with AHSA1/START domain
MTDAAASLVQDDELLIERTFDASRELVFRVWTKPEHLMRWWGPKDYTVVAFDQDFRVGGAYRSCIRAPDGSDNWMSGVYREIVPNARIVMTFRWEDGAWGVDNLVTVTFDDAPGGRTKFRFHQSPFTAVEARDSHIGGWSSLLDKLAKYLESEQ